MNNPSTGWHICTADAPNTQPQLGYTDGRYIQLGEVLTVIAHPVIGVRGLHYGDDLLTAWRACMVHRSHAYICRVSVGGEFALREDSNFVGVGAAQQRTVTEWKDARAICRQLAGQVEDMLGEQAASRNGNTWAGYARMYATPVMEASTSGYMVEQVLHMLIAILDAWIVEAGTAYNDDMGKQHAAKLNEFCMAAYDATPALERITERAQP